MQEIKEMESYAPIPTVEHVIKAVTQLSLHQSNSTSVNLAFETVLILLENAKALNKSEMDFHYERGRMSMINQIHSELETKNK